MRTESQPSLLQLHEKKHFGHPLPVEDLIRLSCKCSSSTRLLRFGIFLHWFKVKGMRVIIVVVPSIAFAKTKLKHRLYFHSFLKQGKYLSRGLELQYLVKQELLSGFWRATW